MTEKAEQIMNRMREKDLEKRVLARLSDPRHRNLLMGDINLLDQDPPAQIGKGDQEIKVLTEMNELQQFDDDNWSRGE